MVLIVLNFGVSVMNFLWMCLMCEVMVVLFIISLVLCISWLWFFMWLGKCISVCIIQNLVMVSGIFLLFQVICMCLDLSLSGLCLIIVLLVVGVCIEVMWWNSVVMCVVSWCRLVFLLRQLFVFRCRLEIMLKFELCVVRKMIGSVGDFVCSLWYRLKLFFGLLFSLMLMIISFGRCMVNVFDVFCCELQLWVLQLK